MKFYITKSPYLEDYSSPAFYEKELFYNYNSTNYREVNLTLPKLEVHIKVVFFINL